MTDHEQMVDRAAQVLSEEYWRILRTALSQELAARKRAQSRIYWSGPNKMERQILRAFRCTGDQIGLAPQSVLKGMRRRKR